MAIVVDIDTDSISRLSRIWREKKKFEEREEATSIESKTRLSFVFFGTARIKGKFSQQYI